MRRRAHAICSARPFVDNSGSVTGNSNTTGNPARIPLSTTVPEPAARYRPLMINGWTSKRSGIDAGV